MKIKRNEPGEPQPVRGVGFDASKGWQKPPAALEHSTTRYGCRIDHDLECTVAVLRDPDGGETNFAGTKEEPNALLQALHHAKADEKQRAEKKAQERASKRAAATEAPAGPDATRPIEQSEAYDAESEGE